MKVRVNRLLAVVALIAIPGSSFAFNVGNYYDLQRHVNDVGENGAGARRVIDFYEQGLSEAFQLVAGMNENKISFGGTPYVCPPSADAITRETVSAAIRRVIGSAENPKNTSPEELHTLVVQPAVIGLSKLFPCGK